MKIEDGKIKWDLQPFTRAEKDYDKEAFDKWSSETFPKKEAREDISKEGLEKWARMVRYNVADIVWQHNMERYWKIYGESPEHIRRNMMPPFAPTFFMD